MSCLGLTVSDLRRETGVAHLRSVDSNRRTNYF